MASNATNLLLALANATTGMNPSTAMPTPTAATPVVVTRNATADAAAAAGAAFMVDYSRKLVRLQVFILLGYSIMCLLSFALICYLRYNRNVALKGDATAARKILLPAFEPLFWILGAVTGAYSLTVGCSLSLGFFKTSIPTAASEGFYCGRMFVLLTVFIYMMQKSVTLPALVRTVLISFGLAMYTLPVEMILTAYQDETEAYKKTRHLTLTAARSLIMCLFLYVLMWPPGRASKRTLREYTLFVFGYYACVVSYSELLYLGHLNEGFFMVYTTSLYASLAPLFIWRVLSADTQHWRGLGQRAVALQSLFRQKHNLNERVSSQGLHVLIEMHRKLVIDFAYLELKHKIGLGSSAIVFNGVLHSKTPVAIKVYTPSEFDENTVAEFSQEAALCGALHHPNIVKFYGMCVCPPTICLVSELCQGSLEDVAVAVASRHQHPHRQQQLINLGYMLDAARAVAYIHSFSPAFVHRDIKPSNFLVDSENTVKLTDFGESRSLPKPQFMAPPVGGTATNTSSFVATKNLLSMKSGAMLSSQQNASRTSSAVSDTPAKLTVKGTVDYMAPEIIQGRAGVAQYGEAADVYSLAITMWDILHPGKEKFPSVRNNNHLHIFELVVDGKRPLLEEEIHPTLREVITTAWHGDPRMRPSAWNIVSILESVQEECFAVFAADLSDELDDHHHQETLGGGGRGGGRGDDHLMAPQTFTAQHAINSMEELCFVNNQAEAMRLGNALMDAGLLHHTKHERPFEAGAGLYFFDEDNINLCQPIIVAHGDEHDEEDESDESAEEDSVDADERIDHLVPLPHKAGGAVRAAVSARVSSVVGRRRGTGGSSTTSGRRHLHRNGDGVSVNGSQPRRKLSTATGTTHGRTYTSKSGGRSEQTIYDNGICSCRKLGQRVEQPKSGAGAKRRFRRHRHKAASEENLLTAKLLSAELVHPLPMGGDESQQDTLQSDFDDFDAVESDVHFEKHHEDHDVGGLA